MPNITQLTELLQHHYGYEQFRTEQAPLVEKIAAGENVLGIMSTGKGKSACFQIPALLKPGVTVVITPLLALMRDQVESLQAKGIDAREITGATLYHQRERVIDDVRRKQVKLLYVTPELFCRGDFAGKFGGEAFISTIVFDEAHCLSLWGDDFRPAYVRAAQMAQVLSKRYEQSGMSAIQRVALTATATPQIEAQLCNTLNIMPNGVYKTDLSRKNLRFMVNHVESNDDRMTKLITIAKHYSAKGQSCVIYTNTRNSVERLTQTLRMVKVNAAAFHAGMDQGEKSRVQTEFLNDQIDVVVATVAFGMGIDKPNIRAVIHYQAPRSIEDYYQQVGRAGRDGYPAVGHLLFNYQSELSKAIELINSSTPNSKQLRAGYEFMRSLYSSDGVSASVYPDVLAGAIDVSRTKAATIIDQLVKFGIVRKLDNHEYQVRDLRDYAVLNAVDTLNAAKLTKVQKMMDYGDEQACKQNLILNYFGQYPEHSCGQCSFCKAPASGATDDKGYTTKHDKRLRASLVALRNEIAQAIRVPPFTIMSDKCIDSMVDKKPMDTAGFIDAGMHSIHARLQTSKVREVIAQFVDSPVDESTASRPELHLDPSTGNPVNTDTSPTRDR